MEKSSLLYSKFRRIIFLLRNKGAKYTYNYIHFYIFWGWIRKHPTLIRLLNWFAPYPSYIEIEVTTKCNLKCIMCEHTYWNEPNRDMSFEEFRGIVGQFPKLKWIGLTGIGESFINKDFIKMLKYVKSKDVLVELYDTFYYINQKTAKEIIEIGVDKIFISLDAATKETYKKIRIGSDFERVTNNVRSLLKFKKEKRAYYPEIAFHYIMNKINLHEILQYIELVNSLAQGEKVTIQFTRMLHEFKETKDLFVEIPEKVIQAADEKAEGMGITLVWNENVPHIKPSVTKCIEWTMPFIFVTGHVIPCCSGNEAGQRDFQKETALGNIFEEDFKKIWNSEKYITFRKMLREGEIPPQCKNCCLYNIKRG